MWLKGIHIEVCFFFPLVYRYSGKRGMIVSLFLGDALVYLVVNSPLLKMNNFLKTKKKIQCIRLRNCICICCILNNKKCNSLLPWLNLHSFVSFTHVVSFNIFLQLNSLNFLAHVQLWQTFGWKWTPMVVSHMYRLVYQARLCKGVISQHWQDAPSATVEAAPTCTSILWWSYKGVLTRAFHLPCPAVALQLLKQAQSS